MEKSNALLLFMALLFALPQQAEAKSKKKKKPNEKDHPNYQHYEDDSEYREGKAKRLSGILLTSIGGGVGGGVLGVGILWNSCWGSTGDTLDKCKKNARATMAVGAIATAASLGFGIPMISVGRATMNDAKDRIDRKYPVKVAPDSGDETSVGGDASFHLASGPWYQDYSISMRVFNREF